MLLAPRADAISITFDDTAIIWPGWENGEDDSIDEIGIPSFTGGTVDITGGDITSITFNQGTTSPSNWGVLSPGDLFIDTDGDDVWDYFVDLTSWTTSGPTNPDPGDGYYNLYEIDLTTNPTYILSTGNWSGWNIRQNHPVGYGGSLDDLTLVGQAHFDGWDSSAPESTYTFTFVDPVTGEPLVPLDGPSFTLGWAVNCGNDVIYETLPIPEPASLLLLGSGLFGLGYLGRKKIRKK